MGRYHEALYLHIKPSDSALSYCWTIKFPRCDISVSTPKPPPPPPSIPLSFSISNSALAVSTLFCSSSCCFLAFCASSCRYFYSNIRAPSIYHLSNNYNTSILIPNAVTKLQPHSLDSQHPSRCKSRTLALKAFSSPLQR